jgi:fatty-acyl-CoA synthase
MAPGSTAILKTPAVRDDTAPRSWLRALALTAPIATNPERILPTVVDEVAQARPDAPALLSEHESFSYRALVNRSNQYARWALRQGLAKGDVVALLMPNRPEYMAIWLGITRIGGIVALINTNLVGSSLAHCIALAQPKHIIVAAELSEAFAAARAPVPTTATIWSHGESHSGLSRIEDALADTGTELAEMHAPPVRTTDCALYIYTSGTTGLPKAARISHGRLMMWSAWFAGMMDAQPSDRMYNCLPMYHSVGGVVATGAMLFGGASVVIRDRFSARQFWDDIVRFDCTLFQYIGELCRYLVNSAPHASEQAHRLRLCCGNGLRPDIWEEFKTRFRIPQILEFYAATEGNVTLFNAEGKPGAIGRVPAFLAHRWPTALVKFDVATGEPVRDERGFCIRCATGETGEALGRIATGAAGVGGRFEGYTSREDSERKVLRDVFVRGDAWFRTGDLMRKDESGYFYFVDRIGDTFRWKGENVSTAEVSAAISEFPGVREATVYGVAVPGREGRAGMATIVNAGTLDIVALRAHLGARLPDYARPVFLRVRAEIEITPTFKHRKNDLVQEGFDPSTSTDPLYFNDPAQAAFVALDEALHQRIVSGLLRF